MGKVTNIEMKQCKHLAYHLNDESKTITCANCNKELDPYFKVSYLCRAMNRLNERVAELEKENAKLKADRLAAAMLASM